MRITMMRRIAMALAISLTATLAPPGLASETDPVDSPWHSRLPFLADEARKRGHKPSSTVWWAVSA